MRNNQPVSGHEYPFPRGKTFISYTNIKGQITRVNEIFAELSGFTPEELINQPHMQSKCQRSSLTLPIFTGS